ncbi:hypothetical protein [Phenylobacterium sp.]|uniref:hypothetical protein n=1 Tax=Phenylobacterium sp. TaxID=1871053 RepID=UPI00391BF997
MRAAAITATICALVSAGPAAAYQGPPSGKAAISTFRCSGLARATPDAGYGDLQRRIVVTLDQSVGFAPGAPGGRLADDQGLLTGPFTWSLSYGAAVTYAAHGVQSPAGTLDIAFTQGGDGNVYGLTITARDFVAGADRVVWTFAAPCGP